MKSAERIMGAIHRGCTGEPEKDGARDGARDGAKAEAVPRGVPSFLDPDFMT